MKFLNLTGNFINTLHANNFQFYEWLKDGGDGGRGGTPPGHEDDGRAGLFW